MSRVGLVVHADDFGLSPGVDLAIQRGLESGAITSASILLAGTSAPEALRWAAAHPRFDYGVHLNLTHGAPTLPAARVPSLVDARGRFHALPGLLVRLVLGRIRTDQVAAEWSAQIEAAECFGVAASHLDSHHHVHLFPRLFRSVAAPLARARGLALRTMDGPAGFVGGRLDAKGMLLSWTSRLAVRGSGGAHGTGTALAGAPDLAVLRSLLGRMKEGTTYELVVHPGYGDEREAEAKFLDAESTRAALAAAGVELRQLRQGGGSAQWT